MFGVGEQFIRDLGLNRLSDDQRQAFLDRIDSELGLRVGVRLADGLSDVQLKEFDSFVDRDDEKVRQWVSANAPDYMHDQSYIELKQYSPENTDDNAILAEYASLKWLSVNRPDYVEVVAEVLDGLKQEIVGNRGAFFRR